MRPIHLTLITSIRYALSSQPSDLSMSASRCVHLQQMCVTATSNASRLKCCKRGPHLVHLKQNHSAENGLHQLCLDHAAMPDRGSRPDNVAQVLSAELADAADRLIRHRAEEDIRDGILVA